MNGKVFGPIIHQPNIRELESNPYPLAYPSSDGR